MKWGRNGEWFDCVLICAIIAVMKRLRSITASAVYHAMSRTVGNAFLFEDREKEMLRKMIWQVADFFGVEVLPWLHHVEPFSCVDSGALCGLCL
jgi:hypothetical protein